MHTALRLLVGIVLVSALSTRAFADPSPDLQALAAYERGMAHFRLDEFDAAIKEWEDGFRTKPAAEFLYNIAQAYRAWKKPDKAISFYRQYLAMAPSSPNRASVEKTIEALEQQRQETPPTVQDKPIAPVVVAATPEPAPPPKKPVTKKAWFWGVVGTGIVVVVGGVVVGAVLGTRSSNPRELPAVNF